MAAKSVQPCRDCKNEGFEVVKGGISGPSDIDWREEAEYIFNRLGQFPELVSVSG